MEYKRTYIINGSKFLSLEEFSQHFSEVVLNNYRWHGNLDAFNDIFRGGFGTPKGGFVLRWENSDLSRERLGYSETAKWLEERITKCHPSNVPHFEKRQGEAKQEKGETLFDMLIEIIRTHGIGGEEAEDGVELILI